MSKIIRINVTWVSVLLLTASWAAAAPNTLSPSEKSSGWELLFDGKTTEGWRGYKKQSFPESGWEVENGWLHCLGKDGGDIVTAGTYKQFDLRWDWKIVTNGNSGVKYFVPETHGSAIGHEYQMLDDNGDAEPRPIKPSHLTASFYDMLKLQVPTSLKPPGEINHSRILVRGNHVEHWLNGVKVLDYDCDSDLVKDAVAKSKFKNVTGFAMPQKAHILLQDHHCSVWFQNIKIQSPPQ